MDSGKSMNYVVQAHKGKIQKLKIKAKGGVNPGGPMIPAAKNGGGGSGSPKKVNPGGPMIPAAAQQPPKTNSGNKQPAAPQATNPKFAVQQKGGSSTNGKQPQNQPMQKGKQK
jgi:hypothetical protein